MRFKVFVSLLVITLVLDIALLSISLLRPGARVFELPVALAAEPPRTGPAAAYGHRHADCATHAHAHTSAQRHPHASAHADCQPHRNCGANRLPTATPAAQLLAAKSVAFTPADRAVRANIRLALDHYYGALTHVVLAPGGVFSFNSTLGVRPQRLPWKNVKLKPTAAPAHRPPRPTAPPRPRPKPPRRSSRAVASAIWPAAS